MAMKCRKCNKYIGRNHDYINCRKECNACYHIACVNLNKADFKALKDTDLLKTGECGLFNLFSIPADNSYGKNATEKTISIISEKCLRNFPKI